MNTPLLTTELYIPPVRRNLVPRPRLGRKLTVVSAPAGFCRTTLVSERVSTACRAEAPGWLLAIWGEVLAELNDLDQAKRQAAKGVELTERGKDVAMLGWSAPRENPRYLPGL
jgi:hypothetical protein